MDQLDYNDFTAVRIGPQIVGWVGPTRTSLGLGADVIIVMGGKTTFRLDVQEFQWGFAELQNLDADLDDLDTIEMLRCAKHFAVPIPNNSVDVSPKGVLTYTPKTVHALMAALHNFFNVLEAEVQMGFHALSPVGVVRKYSELASYGYPGIFAKKLTWRGTLLNDVIQNKKSTMRVKVAYITPEAHYTGCRKIQELPGTFASLGFTPFGAFVGWQTRSKYDSARVVPKNVIHIRANSKEEYKLGNCVFDNLQLLRRFMIERMPEAQEASFFLSVIGDPLEEWVDGESISVEDFRAVVELWDEFQSGGKVKTGR